MESIEAGMIIPTTKSGDMLVLDPAVRGGVKVRFLDTGHEAVYRKHDLLNNRINPYDPMRPRVCGIGFLGVGDFKSSTHSHIYALWFNMLRRATARNVHVQQRWCNFQLFAADLHEHALIQKPYVSVRLLDGRGSYGPNNCVLVQFA